MRHPSGLRPLPLLLGLTLVAGAPRLAGAQAPAAASAASAAVGGVVARTFELRPRDGRDVEADDGYRRHLDWHAAASDPWAWLLWEVVDGPRAGTYVDGTFGHAWADFDRAVDPPGDAADNARNVEPFVTRSGSQAWRLRPELGGSAVDPEGAPLVLRAEYRVRPDAQPAFVDALGRLRAALGGRAWGVQELVSGGQRPTWVVWIPAASWADAGTVLARAAEVDAALHAAAEWSRVETWRLRPDLSLCRAAAARCHRTLGAPAGSRPAR